jgi:hypothetical protein
MRDRYHRSLVDRMRLAGLHGKPSDVASVWADTPLRRRLSVDLTFYGPSMAKSAGELTMPANKSRASGARRDAIALLKADHRQVGGVV